MDAQKSMKTLLRKMSKAGLDAGNRKQIVTAMQAAAVPRTRRRAPAHG